ncbi:MAG: hypothetical protein M3P83_04620 [Actinomycetota bacterium]|nr:hypothetical protein [Actinomycetota bacterium]
MSKILESAILEQTPGARRVHFEGEYVFIEFEDEDVITRYCLSPEAKQIALLEREGRPLDIRPGEVDLLAPADDMQ